MVPSRPPFLSIAVISAALLAYETLLVHLLSIIQPHHFNTLVISLAMLGLGLSGTVTTLFREKAVQYYKKLYPTCLVLSAITMATNFFVVQSLPLNAEELFWDLQQLTTLITALVLLMVPFFLGGCGISLTFCTFSSKSGRIYGYDLCGAGIGIVFIITLLFFVFPKPSLIYVVALTLLGAALSLIELRHHHLLAKLVVLLLLTVSAAVAINVQKLHLSPYKSLSQHLQIKGAEVVAERSSPLGLLQVVENRIVPIRHAPGLSLMAPAGPPPQLGLFTNGEGFTAITKVRANGGKLHYLDQLTSALPYHLKQVRTVLVSGLGGGAPILQAKNHHVADINCVDPNPQRIDLLKDTYNDFSGGLLNEVQLYQVDVREYFSTSEKKFDLILFSTIESPTPSGSGVGGLGENYHYTVEAINSYLDHLTPEGIAAFTGWIKNPPRHSLKLFNTAVDALEQRGVKSPGLHLVLIRGWQTYTLLIKNSRFSLREIKSAEDFGNSRSFDLAYSHQTPVEKANRFNILREPYFYQGTKALLGEDAPVFIARYKYNIRAARDNSPYFDIFFKWSSLPEIWQSRKRGGMALLESGYLILAIVLSVSILISSILIFIPLILHGKSDFKKRIKLSVTRVLPYFFLVGIGFLLIEISFIQQFVLFLGHPLYAFSFCVASFLISGGIGSLIGQRLAPKFSPRKLVGYAVMSIVAIGISYLLFLDGILGLAVGLSLPAKLILALTLVTPLGISMGIPFPLGLLQLASLPYDTGNLVAWAWGINGFGSVISSLLATLLAIHFGFKTVIFTAIIVYLLLLIFFPEQQNAQEQRASC